MLLYGLCLKYFLTINYIVDFQDVNDLVMISTIVPIGPTNLRTVWSRIYIWLAPDRNMNRIRYFSLYFF